MAEETTRPEFFAGQSKVSRGVVSNFLSPTTVNVGPTSDHFFSTIWGEMNNGSNIAKIQVPTWGAKS